MTSRSDCLTDSYCFSILFVTAVVIGQRIGSIMLRDNFATVRIKTEGRKSGNAHLVDSYGFFSFSLGQQFSLKLLMQTTQTVLPGMSAMAACPLCNFYGLLLYILWCCIITNAVYLVHDICYTN